LDSASMIPFWVFCGSLVYLVATTFIFAKIDEARTK
jgi:hypothetical protein